MSLSVALRLLLALICPASQFAALWYWLGSGRDGRDGRDGLVEHRPHSSASPRMIAAIAPKVWGSAKVLQAKRDPRVRKHAPRPSQGRDEI